MFAPRRWIITSLYATSVAAGLHRGGEGSGSLPLLLVSLYDRVVAQRDDTPPQPVVLDSEKIPDTPTDIEELTGGLNPGDRNQLVSALVAEIHAERVLKKGRSNDQIRATIKPKAKLLFATFHEPPLPIPEGRDISLNEHHEKAVEGLMTLAFEFAGGPNLEVPPATSNLVVTVEPFVPTIFRVAKDVYENTLLRDTSLTPDGRRTRLRDLIERKMIGLLDLGPESLELKPLQDHIVSITEAVIAGRSAPTFPSRTSRLTSGDLRVLLDALKSKSKEFEIEGSDPVSFNHKRQLSNFGEAMAKELAGIEDDLKAEEASEVEGLVAQARNSALVEVPRRPASDTTCPLAKPDATPRRLEPDAIGIASDLEGRVKYSLRQINHALASVGLDLKVRKSILTKFVREQLSSVVEQADDLADEILLESTSEPPEVTPVPSPPVIPQVTSTPVLLIVVPQYPFPGLR